ncbi:MAG: hypothetical protein QNK33_10130, partial [Bacteroidales bacterium]|nr:hypothetical protein [Bacteroidales bacterium]
SADHFKLAMATYESYLEKQYVIMEEAMKEGGLERKQLTAPGLQYAKERIKKIKNELFFLGEIKE